MWSVSSSALSRVWFLKIPFPSSFFHFSIINIPHCLIFFCLRPFSMFDRAKSRRRCLPASRSSPLSPVPLLPPPPCPLPPPPRNVAANLSLQPVPPHRRGILRVQGKGNVPLPALGTLQSVNRGLPPAARGAPLENYIRPIIQHSCYDFLQQTRGCWMGVRRVSVC